MRAADSSKTQASHRPGRHVLRARPRDRTVTNPPTPDRNDDDEIPLLRLAGWMLLAAVVVFGIYLYFRCEGQLAPLLG